MRIPAILTAAFLTLTAPTAAQAGVEVAVKGGLSFGNISNKGLLPGNLESRTGFAAGAAIATRGLVGLGIEGLFAQRGVTSEVAINERKLDYVDVPVYLRVALPTPSIRPYAYAGPQVSFELRCQSGDEDCPDANRKKTAYAGVIGAGLRFGALTGFLIEARYIYGLNDLRLSTITDEDSYKTRSFLIMAGLSF